VKDPGRNIKYVLGANGEERSIVHTFMKENNMVICSVGNY
jgi:hypothetical protein